MPDILSTAQPNTSDPATQSPAAPEPPTEPAPEPLVSATDMPISPPPPPPVETEAPAPPEPMPSDNLVVPPPVEVPPPAESKPADSAGGNAPPPLGKPKKKRINAAVVISGILLLIITLPLVVIYTAQRKLVAEIRSQAAFTESGVTKTKKIGGTSGTAKIGGTTTKDPPPPGGIDTLKVTGKAGAGTKTGSGYTGGASGPITLSGGNQFGGIRVGQGDAGVYINVPFAPGSSLYVGAKGVGATVGLPGGLGPSVTFGTGGTSVNLGLSNTTGGTGGAAVGLTVGTDSKGTTGSKGGVTKTKIAKINVDGGGRSSGTGIDLEKVEEECKKGRGCGSSDGPGDGPGTPPPTGGAQCVNIVPFNNEGILTSTDLALLHSGDAIGFAYSPGGDATKVRFRVNGGDWHETTTKSDFSGTDYYMWAYELADTTTFSVEAQWFDGTNWN